MKNFTYPAGYGFSLIVGDDDKIQITQDEDGGLVNIMLNRDEATALWNALQDVLHPPGKFMVNEAELANQSRPKKSRQQVPNNI